MARNNINRVLINVLILMLILIVSTQAAFWSKKEEKAAAAPEVVSETVQTDVFPEDEAAADMGEYVGGEYEGEQFEGELTDFDEVDGRTDLHFAAAVGDIDTCDAILGSDEGSDFLHARDGNGWQAIHEAAREGHTHIVRYLLERGADIGATTDSADTPLSLARDALEEGHELILFLEELDAPDKFIEDEPEAEGEAA